MAWLWAEKLVKTPRLSVWPGLRMGLGGRARTLAQDCGDGPSLVLVSRPQGSTGGVSFAENERATYWGRDLSLCLDSITTL